MHISCRSIFHKLPDIETLLLQLDFDTLAVTEMWLQTSYKFKATPSSTNALKMTAGGAGAE